jgi:hypothetical protein
MINKINRIWIVRPNLGNPSILKPEELKRFTITAAYRKQPWNAEENTVEWPKNSHELFLQFRQALYFGIEIGNEFIPFKVFSAHDYKRHPEYHDNYSEVKHAVTSEQQQYINNFRWEVKVDIGLEDYDIDKIKQYCGGWPSLFNLKSRTRSDRMINYHSIYVHEDLKDSNDFTILQITDTHIAKRYDIIPEILCRVRNEVECKRLKNRYNNPNDNFRAFIKEANSRIEKGENVIVALTGDIVDYYFDGYWDGHFACGQGNLEGWEDRREQLADGEWDSNIKKFHDIVTGRDGKGEALKCPIYTVIGNHEYYANEILMYFKAGTAIGDIFVDAIFTRCEYRAFNLHKNEALDYDFWAYPRKGGSYHTIGDRKTFKVIKNTHVTKLSPTNFETINLKNWQASIVDAAGDHTYWLIKPKSWILSQYLCEVNYDLDYELKIGKCHFLFLNTGHDLFPTKDEVRSELSEEMHEPDGLSFLTNHRNLPSMILDFKAGGPHARGITPEHLKILSRALEQGGEKFIFIFTHAPLLGLKDAKTEGIGAIYEEVLKKEGHHAEGSERWIKGLYGINDHTFRKYGFVIDKRGFFKQGKRDPYLDFFSAEGCGEKGQFQPKIFPNFLNLLSQELSTTTDIPILIFSGHTHKIHEFRVNKLGTGPREFYKFYYYTDDYSGKYFKKKEDSSTILYRYLYLKGISPLLFTSDALKHKNPKYREIDVRGLSLASLEMKPISNIEKTGNFSPGCDLITLRAYNKQYVCAEGGGDRELVANREFAKEWEIFELIHLEENKVALKACNNMFVRAEGGGGGKLKPDRSWIKKHEAFTLIEKGTNKIALRTYKEKYVCALGGGGGELLANRDQAHEWETFEVEKVHLLLHAPSLIVPKNGKVYSKELMTIPFRWSKEDAAISYFIDIEVKKGNKWSSFVGPVNVQANIYPLSMNAKWSQYRWRIWAVGITNNKGPKSGWSYFEFR